jgi:phage terminase large subunit-like protein
MPRLLAEVTDSYKRAVALGSRPLLRELAKADLFFLLLIVCRRVDLEHQWLLERCDEVCLKPDGYLDLWAREHGKTSIISIGKTIQDILCNPEITIGVFSHTRPMAKGILRAVKYEFESNKILLELFPDILWENPKKEAPKWSEDDGIIVQRKGNPKESTLEAWGLVDGQPTGKHFNLLYDDIVTQGNAASPDMRAKTLAALELSYNLGVRGGWRRFAGTRYHYADAYKTLVDRQTAIPRIYPAADEDGRPVLLDQETLDDKRRDMGPYTYSAQMMLDPKQDGSVGFREEWWREWTGNVTGNTYIVVDPANAKKKKSDYTALWVITASEDQNFYVRHIVRDRLNLSERIDLVFEMHREYQPRGVGYEQYGMQADIDAIEIEQRRQGYRFKITPVGGQVAKFDRISTLIPLFEQGRIWFPPRCTILTRDDGMVDMVQRFRDDEFLAWPYAGHEDMLDGLARITDPDLQIRWPNKRSQLRPVIAPFVQSAWG